MLLGELNYRIFMDVITSYNLLKVQQHNYNF